VCQRGGVNKHMTIIQRRGSVGGLLQLSHVITVIVPVIAIRASILIDINILLAYFQIP
jgi:hypothetical protein